MGTAAGGPGSCVILVVSGRAFDPGCEAALSELARGGHPVWRVEAPDPPPDARDWLAADALAAGFEELLWVDPAVVFDPAAVGRLRSHGLPFVCGVYPEVGRRALACTFPPTTTEVRLGRRGGLVEVLSCRLGFALTKRAVFEAIRAHHGPPGAGDSRPYAYFASDEPGGPGRPRDPGRAADEAFCRRAKAAGVRVMADTAVRLWHVGPYRYGWEDAGRSKGRFDDYTLRLAAPPAPAPDAPAAEAPTAETLKPLPLELPANPFRVSAAPLPATFPRLRCYVVTYPANADSLALTLDSLRASDWGEGPQVVAQPADWPIDRESGARNYRRALEAAAEDGCDFALVLEDDVRVNRHLRHNLAALPLVARGGCDYLGLFLPDLVADPWEREEPHLGYRLARPLYTGPNRLWERHRVWGCQALLLSGRLVRAALARWDRLTEGQDTRLLAVCREFGLPLWYTRPCLAEHAPLRSAFDTPAAHAPDFDPDFRLAVGPGFVPPDGVPGPLSAGEGRALWEAAKALDVLELGTGCGRGAVCLAQSARRVVSVGRGDPAEAAEWVRRFGLSGRVEFRRGSAWEPGVVPPGDFGLVFVGGPACGAYVARDLESAVPPVAPGGLLAVHGYPDPARPVVRRVVDALARRHGWRRAGQAGFLGVFRA